MAALLNTESLLILEPLACLEGVPSRLMLWPPPPLSRWAFVSRSRSRSLPPEGNFLWGLVWRLLLITSPLYLLYFSLYFLSSLSFSLSLDDDTLDLPPAMENTLGKQIFIERNFGIDNIPKLNELSVRTLRPKIIHTMNLNFKLLGVISALGVMSFSVMC